jgi:hypothetical protein
MLNDAEALFLARRDQGLRAEARATTLQASAGIAIGLAFTGAAFLLDPNKVADRGWRIALTVFLAALLGCLGMTGYLATRATVVLLGYREADAGEIVSRASRPDLEASGLRAISLRRLAEDNYYFSQFKWSAPGFEDTRICPGKSGVRVLRSAAERILSHA